MLEEGSRRFGPFHHGFTYVAHPVCAAAAMANIDILEREDLPGNAARTGAWFLERLRARFGGIDIVGDIRGQGLLAAIELVADRATRARFPEELRVGQRVSRAAREEGLVIRALPEGDIVAFSPALAVTPAQLDDILDRLLRAVERVRAGLSPAA